MATNQLDQINLYGYKRFPLMKAFRRLMDGDIPSGSSGLNLTAVKNASRELYLLDGQISFDRAMLYVGILNSMTTNQVAYLESMKGKGFNSWPDITNAQIDDRMRTLPPDTAVAVMTYAGDLFSWYAGSVDADVYFCPERQGTYYGGFYIKDAPAVGHEGYSIDEQLTATAGAALCDSSKGYVTTNQAAVMSSLVGTQRNNLYAGATNIVAVRTQIATLLRSLLTSPTASNVVKSQVLELSSTYGELDGENNYYYATVFAQVYSTLTASQKRDLFNLRQSIMSGTYTNGTRFDYSICTTPYLYSAPITNQTVLASYIANTDYLFFDVDTVGDGIPDWWRAKYFGGNGATTNADSGAAVDFDNDGLNNLSEYLADTDPTNAVSRLAITGLVIGGNDVQLTWTGGSNAWQVIECTSDLVSNQWSVIYTNIPPTPITNAITQGGATASGKWFCRVKAWR